MDPGGEHLFSLCPFSWIDFWFCPGCGLGHAIAFLFRGEWVASWKAHPLGLPVLVVLLWRVLVIIRNYRTLRYFYLNHTSNG
ncbi:hypothetical protein C1N53_15730 [Pontibacter sp. SGAir0037]|nr:hypothetical protein C1N53_15730 [Pontibacter sp. SGAir0037]